MIMSSFLQQIWDLTFAFRGQRQTEGINLQGESKTWEQQIPGAILPDNCSDE